MIMQGQTEMINKRIQTILDKIKNATTLNKRQNQVRLIAVSKTKSVQEIKAAYDCGLRNFGQNYVDEIQAKQPKLPLDIKWHFIGHLQSNKIKKVIVPNLQYLETVDRTSLAQKLQKHLQKIDKQKKLKILIQVKTSEQQSKHGASNQQVFPLVQYIYEKCPNLIFKGLMTIGKQGDYQAFLQMVELKNKIIQKHKITQEDFQLSMGMSGDFQVAIEHGSTSVRVGSSIFGPRNYAKKQQKPNQKVQQKIQQH